MRSDQHTSPSTTRRLSRLVALFLAIGLLGGLVTSSANAQPTATTAKTVKPTIVLVHGAFADAESWNGVTTRLIHAGYPVIAPAIPLRDLAGDSAYLASVLATINGPIVLVGHSYGGAVITDAATGNPNVKALVYIAAFALDNDESLADISGTYTNSDLAGALLTRPYPLADGTSGTDLYINPAMFKNVFAKDVSDNLASQMAAAQRPLSVAAFTGKSSEPAWKTIPSWYMVATKDRAIDPAGERAMAARMGAHTIQVSSSHAVLVSHPATVASFIATAAHTVG
jgi:pimeloyl-ACP methyl ester carboxylesterase